jgi:hypothetical protein
MFAKNKVSQSLVDAVSSIVNEAEKVPTSTGMKVYGSRYGNSQKARKDQLKSAVDDVKGPSKSELDKEKEVKEELKGNQHKIDKNKNNKIDAEDFKMLRKEELKGNQHKIDANKNNKIDAHDFQLLRGKKKVKEDTFAGKLLNSLSESEEIRKAINEVMKKDATAGDWIHDFVHSKNPKFAGKSTKERQKMALGAYYNKKNESVEDLEMTKVSDEAEDTAARKSIKAKDTEKVQKIDNFDVKYGTPNEFSEEVEELDETRGAQAMKASGVKQSPDKLLARTGMNMAHKFPRPGQTNLGNIPGMNTPGVAKSTADYAEKRRGDRAKELKPAIKAASGTHGPKGKLPEEVELEEDVPKKNDDAMAGKQNLEPAKKGVVGTVKSDFKNFKNFLAGKKETNEVVDPNKQTIDTLAGRSKKVPKEAKIDNAHSSAKVELKSEEVESLEEDRWLMRYLLSKGVNPKFINRNQKVAHAKSDSFKKWKRDHQSFVPTQFSREEVNMEAAEVPFAGPYTKTKKDVKDKSGAIHTPMSRAKDLAQQAMKRVKSETMMGKAGTTSESKKK